MFYPSGKSRWSVYRNVWPLKRGCLLFLRKLVTITSYNIFFQLKKLTSVTTTIVTVTIKGKRARVADILDRRRLKAMGCFLFSLGLRNLEIMLGSVSVIHWHVLTLLRLPRWNQYWVSQFATMDPLRYWFLVLLGMEDKINAFFLFIIGFAKNSDQPCFSQGTFKDQRCKKLSIVRKPSYAELPNIAGTHTVGNNLISSNNKVFLNSQ